MQKDKKKIHKKIVKCLKRRNRELAKDNYIGADRFRIYLYSEKYFKYSDNSGYYVNFYFKMVDNRTGNSAYFICNNYNYQYEIFSYLNDFLIRCSSGSSGHYPSLHYLAYDVHEIISYDGKRKDKTSLNEGNIVATYSWLKGVKYEIEENY